jgi:hypothetical protein
VVHAARADRDAGHARPDAAALARRERAEDRFSALRAFLRDRLLLDHGLLGVERNPDLVLAELVALDRAALRGFRR